MPISWNDSMSTGVLEVDNQHKELFRQVGLLHDAMAQGQGREKISKILDFLGDYVISHFAAEEAQMDRLECPAAEANKQAHADFLAVFTDLRQRFEHSGASSALVLEIHNTVSNWLVEHINKIDTQLSACPTGA